MNETLRRTRRQLVTLDLAVIALVLVLAGTVVYTAFAATLLDPVDAALEATAEALARGDGEHEAAEHFGEGYRGGQFVLLIGAGGRVLADPQRLGAAAAKVLQVEGLRTVRLGDDEARVLTRRVTIDRAPSLLVVGSSLESQSDALRRVLIVLLATGAGAFALSFGAAWVLAGRALVPIGGAFRRQQEFVADASHELRTPLAIIRVALDLLARAPADAAAERAGLVEDARGEVARMERLVGDLLTVARSDLGALPLALARVDGAELVREAARRIAPLARERGVALGVEAAPPCAVDADAGLIAQALLAVADNALRHTPPGGRVLLSAERVGGAVTLGVRDTGEGISAEHLARITDRFYRADRSRTRDRGGAGLGLAIVRAILEAHGGSLTIESAPGAGTTVRLRLPGAGP